MSNKYPGGFITASPVAPAGPFQDDAASGVWTLSQAAYWQEQGLWPIAGNSSLPTVGDAYEGGFFAGQIGVNGVATHNLVVGPVSSAYNSSKQWKTSNSATTGTDSVINGPANSAAMNNASHPAAQFCEAVNVGGYTDWYMPAKNELEVCYYNLKPTTAANNTISGTNTNAVPARASNYTGGSPATNPAQTLATNFQSTGTEDFPASFHWCSTQKNDRAWFQAMSSGSQDDYDKTNAPGVRAIRRVAV